MPLQARFPALCCSCKGRIEPGDLIVWDPATKAVSHYPSCPPAAAPHVWKPATEEEAETVRRRIEEIKRPN